MVTAFQKHQHLTRFVDLLLRTRNDLQVLRDMINAYAAAESGLSEGEKAAQLVAIEATGQGVKAVLGRVNTLTAFIDGNLTGQQRTELQTAADALYGFADASVLTSIYTGMKNFAPDLVAVRKPSEDPASSYADFRSDLAALVAAIDAIPFVEIGTGPVT